MRRTLLFTLLFGWAAVMAGCKTEFARPKTDHLDRDRLKFELESASHKLQDLEAAKSTRPDRIRDLHEAQLAVPYLEWRLGTRSEFDMHTVRRNALTDLRCYEHAWIKTGDSTELTEARVDVRVQQERWHLNEIDKDTYESALQSVRQKIAQKASAHARNEDVAKSMADAALAEFDAQLAN